MIILGIVDGHNSACAVYQDGSIVYAAQEERFTREKNQDGFPKKAIRYALQSLGISARDIDYAVFTGTNIDPFWANSGTHRYSISDYIQEQNNYWYPALYENKQTDYFLKQAEANVKDRLLRKNLKEYYKFSSGRDPAAKRQEAIHYYQSIRKKLFYDHVGHCDNILFYDHHLCHSAHAYWSAPYSIRNNAENLVITMDAFGDVNNCLVSRVDEDRNMRQLLSYSRFNVARFYKYCTLLLGMKPLEHEYKVMGLAPYCKNKKAQNEIFNIYKNALWVTHGLKLVSRTPVKDSYFHFKKLLEPYRFDEIAAGIQYYFESFVARFVDLCLRKYKKDTLFLNGGAAMNVKANHKVSELRAVKNIYVSPSPGDESICIGACLYAASRNDPDFDTSRHPFPTIYLGYEITDTECRNTIRRHFNDKSKYRIRLNAPAGDIAQYLARNLILARAAGKMEFGARALGNRSIIANPLSFENIRKMNEKIKLRDFWMPFAPVILKEYENRYIQNDKKLSSPYMMMSFPTTKAGREKLAAAKHPYDDTVRPQILSRSDNPDYYDLINEFGKETGVYGLVNTSFNLHGFPIVCTADDAAEVFLKTDLDGLLLNGHLILKKRNL